MKIAVKNRAGQLVTYPARVGQKLVGMRIEQMVFEYASELKQLATPEGQRWLAEHAQLAMPQG